MISRRAVAAVWWRDLVVIGRTRPMLAAVALYVATLAVHLLAWNDPVRTPHFAGGSLYAQHHWVQCAATALVLPWAVCRFIAEEGPSWPMMSFFAQMSPSQLFGARLCTMALFVAILVSSGLPLVVLAREMSAIPLGVALLDTLSLVVFSVGVASVSMAVALVVRDAIAGWLLSTAIAIVTGAMMSRAAGGSAVLGLALVLATVVAARGTSGLARRMDEPIR